MSEPAVTQTAEQYWATFLENQVETVPKFFSKDIALRFAEAYAASRERWIPVADPPSSSEEVLTINNSTGIYILGNYLGAEGWCDEDGDPIHPTHYMFRLAPPRGENAELKRKGNASHACYCGELPSGKKCMACQLQTAERSLAELREKMRWIPVAEKFPEFAGTYIVAVDGLGDDGENYIGTLPADWSPDGKYWHDLRGWGSNEVTHWMPLPDPPVAEAERLSREG